MRPTTDNSLALVISEFQATATSLTEWRGRCPVCQHHCLIIKSGDTAPVVAWCSRDCDKAAVNAAVYAVADLKRKTFTVADFCALKRLPEPWVRSTFGVHDGTYTSKAGKKSPAVFFPYLGEWQYTRTADGERVERPCGGFKARFARDSHVTAWAYYTEPMLYGLLPQQADVIVLCEGESDTITLTYCGIPALGISGAPHGWRPEFANITTLANAKRILVIQEPGDAGAKLVAKVAASFPAGRVWAVKLPAKDPSELWINNTDEQFVAEWEKAVAEAIPVGAEQQGCEYKSERMSDIMPKPLTWLWPGRIPRGKITIFGGNPGVGKSLAGCSLAAIVTTGRQFPDETTKLSERDPAEVLLMFCEDDAEDTVVPRLMASEANLTKIHRLKKLAITNAGDKPTRTERELAFDTDLQVLKRFLADNPAVQLVIVDPISSYLGNIKPNDEKQVRDVLVPLGELARDTGVTFVLLAHFNKRSDVSALHKVMGAVAMTGVARAAWLFAEDKDSADEGNYLMLEGKMNLSRKAQGLEYTIQDRPVILPGGETVNVGAIEWGNATDKTADRALASVGAFEDEGGSKVKSAGEFLQRYLADGAKPAKEVIEAATGQGIGERTLNSAKKAAGVTSCKVLDKWFWRTPGTIETEAGLHP